MFVAQLLTGLRPANQRHGSCTVNERPTKSRMLKATRCIMQLDSHMFKGLEMIIESVRLGTNRLLDALGGSPIRRLLSHGDIRQHNM